MWLVICSGTADSYVLGVYASEQDAIEQRDKLSGWKWQTAYLRRCNSLEFRTDIIPVSKFDID